MNKCKICKKELNGRSDRKFCSLKCKNYYHINLRRNTDDAVNEINKILHRNRSILREIMGKYKTLEKISRIILEKMKFNFKYHTHSNTNSAGKIYYFVYDYAWMSFSDDTILIIHSNK